MRKIKKINGFLVVKFNDREKREYEGTALGEYGVIDAEVYTGNLDIDRGAMEYPLSPVKANGGRLCEKLKNAMRNGWGQRCDGNFLTIFVGMVLGEKPNFTGGFFEW